MAAARGWRAFLGGDCDLDPEPLEAFVFCPAFAARKFGAGLLD